jgi:hypothetical protein
MQAIVLITWQIHSPLGRRLIVDSVRSALAAELLRPCHSRAREPVTWLLPPVQGVSQYWYSCGSDYTVHYVSALCGLNAVVVLLVTALRVRVVPVRLRCSRAARRPATTRGAPATVGLGRGAR